MNKIGVGHIVLLLCLLQAFSIHAQNAPVSAIQSSESTGSAVTIAITATGINNIGSCNLQILYNDEIIHCSSVSKGVLFPGNLATNLSDTGVITIGWYTWPGINLPDHTEIFLLNFTKIAEGTSAITWNADYQDRQWSDGNSVTLNDLPFESFYSSGSVTFQDDAPVTAAPTLETCLGLPLDIPVTVTNFNTIGAVSLTLHFNDDAMTYQSFTNNSGFPGLTAFNPGPGIITIAGFSSSSGITLPDSAILFTLSFIGVEGSSGLFWYDDGVSCEFTGPPPTYLVLNDVPQESFYIDGWVTALSPPEIISQPVSPEPVIELSGTAIFSVEASGTGLDYQWEEFTDSWNSLSDGGVFVGCLTADLTIINPPLSMNGNKYRCIVAGSCEPPAITDGNATLTVVESTGLNGQIISKDHFIFLGCSPNPVRDKTIIAYSLPCSGHIKLKLNDLEGKEKLVLINSFELQGQHTCELDGKLLHEGMYLLEIELKNINTELRAIEKIIRLK